MTKTPFDKYNWRTTTFGIVSAFFAFVLFSPELGWPAIVTALSKFALVGGLAGLGIAAKDYRALKILVSAAGLSAAASAATPINDTLAVFDGTRFTGRITIDGPAITTADGRTIARWRNTYVVEGGVFNVELEPNDTARPANSSYVVRYYPTKGNAWQETWFVPTSAAPLKIGDVKLTTTLTQGVTIQPNQLGSGGASTGQCLTWDGTRWKPGGCGSGGAQATFIDQESPVGALDGTNRVFTLAEVPVPASGLMLFRNGLAMRQGGDYTIDTKTITFVEGATPQEGDVLLAWYRYGTGMGTVTFVDQETPSGILDGTNRAFALAQAPSPVSGLLLFRNGIVLKRGFDYDIADNIVTFVEAATPQADDTLLAWYRY